MKMLKDNFIWIVIMVLVCGGVVLSSWGNYEGRRSECREYGELTGYEVKILKSNRCMVNRPDEGWTPAFRRDE